MQQGKTRTHFLSSDDLELFVAANGLQIVDEDLFTPDGSKVGAITACGPKHLVVISNEQYAVPPVTVEAWWPGFRTAWRIIGSDGTAVGPTLRPDEVICDLCNRSVELRPVPVVDKHALCRQCFEEMGLPFPGKVKPYVPQSMEPTWSESH